MPRLMALVPVPLDMTRLSLVYLSFAFLIQLSRHPLLYHLYNSHKPSFVLLKDDTMPPSTPVIQHNAAGRPTVAGKGITYGRGAGSRGTGVSSGSGKGKPQGGYRRQR